ncbi:hypothetical protein M885DRAFT_590752 [Pelagophyceae sp. CCMP2097]|nr:hypothetical protein M885DRAFT_590752 [Pelagophyceae sp. CCMP2097]
MAALGLSVLSFCPATNSIAALRSAAAAQPNQLTLMMAYQQAVAAEGVARKAAASVGHMATGLESRAKMDEFDDVQMQLYLAQELTVFQTLQIAHGYARAESIAIQQTASAAALDAALLRTPILGAPPLTHAASTAAVLEAATSIVDGLLLGPAGNAVLTVHTARVAELTTSAAGVAQCLKRTSMRLLISQKAAQLAEGPNGAVLALEFTAVASEALRLDSTCDVLAISLVDAAKKKIADKRVAAAAAATAASAATRAKRARPASTPARGKSASGNDRRGDRGGGGKGRGPAPAAS